MFSPENPDCMELFIEMEFRSADNIHECQSNNPELTSSKQPIEMGKGITWPKNEQVSTLHIASNAAEVPFFFAQDFFVKSDETITEFEIEVQLAQKFIDQHLVVPVVEVLDVDLESANDFDLSHHRIGARPECHYNCLVAGHKLYNAFTIEATVPSGSMIRVWLYQHPKLD